MTALYEAEFPDFGFLDVAIPEGFQDVSWHNDAMPAFEKELSSGNTLRVWVNYADADKRDSGKNAPRFALALHDGDAMFIRMLAESNDWQEIVNAVSLAST